MAYAIVQNKLTFSCKNSWVDMSFAKTSDQLISEAIQIDIASFEL